MIEEVSKEVAVEELTGKEAMPEEATVEVAAPVEVTAPVKVTAPVEAAAPEEVPVVNVPPCLEELVWATLQEVHKMRKSAERRKHFEFGIWDKLRKLVTLKGKEVSLVQGNVMPAGVAQESAMVGKSQVQGKGKKKARELEEEETLV